MKKIILTLWFVVSLFGYSGDMCTYYLQEVNKSSTLLVYAIERGDSLQMDVNSKRAIITLEKSIVECGGILSNEQIQELKDTRTEFIGFRKLRGLEG